MVVALVSTTPNKHCRSSDNDCHGAAAAAGNENNDGRWLGKSDS